MIKPVLAGLAALTLAACGGAKEAGPDPDPNRALVKYEPPYGNVLVFAGQDNVAVGGTEKWQDGYVDHFGTPAGFTHYVYFSEDKQNPFGFSFDIGSVDGLNSETTWGAGPMCMRCYMESAKLSGTVAHLSISMEHDDEPQVAAGEYDHNIQELADFLKEYSDVPFLIRIGYEFDGPWNSYEPEPFKQAWRRIVDKLRAEGVTNFATVMASFTRHAADETWEAYWPGDEYVDWVGYSYFGVKEHFLVRLLTIRQPKGDTLAFARKKGKPVFIAESTPRGYLLGEQDEAWEEWFEPFFEHIEANKDVVKAISYINSHWAAQPMWEGPMWGDTRLQVNAKIDEKWRKKMSEDLYVHETKGVYKLINATDTLTEPTTAVAE